MSPSWLKLAQVLVPVLWDRFLHMSIRQLELKWIATNSIHVGYVDFGVLHPSVLFLRWGGGTLARLEKTKGTYSTYSNTVLGNSLCADFVDAMKNSMGFTRNIEMVSPCNVRLFLSFLFAS